MAEVTLPPEKRCLQCGVTKPLSEFYERIVAGKRRPRVYCKPCHNARTARSLRKYGPFLDQERKTCVSCLKTLPLDSFQRRGKDGRHSRCQGCRQQYDRDYWQKTKDSGGKASRYSARDDRKLRNVLYLFDYLKSHACLECGERDPVVLEFHHREPAQKHRDVSVMSQHCSLKVLTAEIAKCDVLCANCHRRKTAEERGFRMFLLANDSEQPQRLVQISPDHSQL